MLTYCIHQNGGRGSVVSQNGRWGLCGGRHAAKTERRRFVIVRFCVLASGSSGNCAFLATSKTRLLIDAGLSVRELSRRLAEIGERPEDLDAVVISHEHTDHLSGLARLVRWRAKRNKPLTVFVSRLTAPQIEWEQDGEKPALELFQAGSGWVVGNIVIQSFTVPHDAVDPVGFCLFAEGIKIGVVTDLGYVPESIKVHLRRIQVLLIESNHDIEMLRVGPYPWSVKQRVMGRNGHLSNTHTCDFLESSLDGGIQTLILGHLSEHNNHPEIVRRGAERKLMSRGLSPRLAIAEQSKATEVFTY